MIYRFQTSEMVCSRMIEIDIDEEKDVIRRVEFVGGCPGNLAGIGRLAVGMKPAAARAVKPCRKLLRGMGIWRAFITVSPVSFVGRTERKSARHKNRRGKNFLFRSWSVASWDDCSFVRLVRGRIRPLQKSRAV